MGVPKNKLLRYIFRPIWVVLALLLEISVIFEIKEFRKSFFAQYLIN